MLKLSEKKEIVEVVSMLARKSLSAVAANYSGLTAPEMTALRAQARDSKVTVQIIRNTLAKRALAGTDFAGLSDYLVGPILLAFAENEPGATAKLVRDFAKTNVKLATKAICVSGQIYSAAQLDAVASLPTKEQAISILMSVMKAPISKFVRTLAEPHAKLVRTIAAIREKKEAEAAA
jgi:large subunit ribosomal protein L10